MEGYKKVMIVGVLLVIGIGMVSEASGQYLVCNMPASGLKSCLASVSGDNPVDPPYPDCCDAMKKADLKCFCRYKDSGWLTYYGINPAQAMALPYKCKRVADPNWHC